MYYELYIDVLFLENFMMDSLLLLAVNRVLGCGRAYGRIFLGGALGSLLTCVVIALPMPAAVKLVFFHIIVNSLMITAGLKISGKGQFARAFVLLYVCAFFLGGILSALRPYLRYISLFYAAAATAYFAFSRLWKLLCAMSGEKSRLCEAVLYSEGKSGRTRGLWDTGNVLSDPYSGEPVCIVDPGFAREMFGRPEEMKGFHYIPYRCVSGESVMKVFRIDKMCIRMDGEKWVSGPLLAVSEGPLSEDGEYGIIINPGVLSK